MTQQQAEFDRIRGYLQQQASQRSVEELIVRVQEAVAELHAAAEEIDAELLDRVPPGETWTPAACLGHSTGSNLQVAEQISGVALNGKLEAGTERPSGATREQMLEGHSAGLASLFEGVRKADPAAHLEVKWRHPMFGELNWREWLLFLRIHARDHARQLAAMKTAFGEGR
jgi:hypothetical protein